MKDSPRYVAVIPSSTSVAQYIVDCRVIVTMMTDNVWFPSPMPPLSQIKTRTDDLETDEKLAQQGGKGLVEKRDLTLDLLRGDMRLLTAYVQSIVDNNATEGAAIVKSAGLSIGKKADRTKPPVEVKRGKASGSVVLDAKAPGWPVTYHWQMSTDQVEWKDLPMTFKARMKVDGLTPTKVYYFRLRVTTRDGLSDPSSVLSVVVL